MAGVGGSEGGGRTKTESERQEERATRGVSPSHILPSTLIESQDEQVLQRKGNETPSVGFAQPLLSYLTPLRQDIPPRTCSSTHPGKCPLCARQTLCKDWGQESRWSACGDRGAPGCGTPRAQTRAVPGKQLVTFVGVDRPVESTVKGIRTVWPVGSG